MPDTALRVSERREASARSPGQGGLSSQTPLSRLRAAEPGAVHAEVMQPAHATCAAELVPESVGRERKAGWAAGQRRRSQRGEVREACQSVVDVHAEVVAGPVGGQGGRVQVAARRAHKERRWLRKERG